VYNFRVVSHENINSSDYCTISQKGVARMRSDDETEFVTLDRWEQEYNLFQDIIKVSGKFCRNSRLDFFYLRIGIIKE